jgi:hypothetical protein
MHIRRAIKTDIPHMVAIAEAKRVEYEGYSPVFWRKAPDSSPKQEQYLRSLLASPDIMAFVAQLEDSVTGFVIGALTTPPPCTLPAVLSVLSTTSRWHPPRSGEPSGERS